MLSAGAAGETAAQLSAVLGLPGGLPSVTGTAAANLDCMVREDGSNNGNQLNIADSLFAQQGFSYESSFLSLLNTDAAPLHTEDFEGSPQSALSRINSWVSSGTGGQIPNLLSPGSVDPSTRLVLVNAVYFKGMWQVQFEPGSTQPGPFTTATGSVVMPPMMNVLLRNAQYGYGSGFEMLEIAHGGDRLGMDILLPDTAFPPWRLGCRPRR